MPATRSTRARVPVLVALTLVCLLTLPVTAALLDRPGQENWILPVAVLVAALLGAGVGAAVPSVAGSGATARRGALVGAAVAVVSALVGVLALFLLVSGFRGA